jgi:hypothetical protein
MEKHMANDADISDGLPKWPAAATEGSNVEPPVGSQDAGWLIVAAIAYPVIGFGVLLLGGGNMGPAAFGFEVIVVPPLVAIAVAIGARLEGARLSWSSVVVFVGWVLLVALAQFEIWGSAVAAV